MSPSFMKTRLMKWVGEMKVENGRNWRKQQKSTKKRQKKDQKAKNAQKSPQKAQNVKFRASHSEYPELTVPDPGAPPPLFTIVALLLA